MDKCFEIKNKLDYLIKLKIINFNDKTYENKSSNYIYLQKNKINFRSNFFYFEFPYDNKKLIKKNYKNYFLKEYKIKNEKLIKVDLDDKQIVNFKVILSKSMIKYSNIFLYNNYYIKNNIKNFNLNLAFNIKKNSINLLKNYQKIYFLIGRWELGRKDNLFYNINKMKLKFKNDFLFFPETYILEKHYKEFLKNKKNYKYWILKPVDQARGNGIKLISNKEKIKIKENYLASSYISNTHLINNTKYDLRIYVLITSINPLEIFIFKEGLAKFASNKYEIGKDKIKNNKMHLTNFSVNKNNFFNQFHLKKICLSLYKKLLKKKGIKFDLIFDQIKDIVNKTIISVYHQLSNVYNKFNQNCYEIFGFDILIDNNLKAWLLEVNVLPSMNLSTDTDKYVKNNLLVDTLNLLMFKPTIQISKNKKLKKNFTMQELINTTKKNKRKINFYRINNLLNLFLDYTASDIDMIINYEEKLLVKNNYILSFPNINNYFNYVKYFKSKIDKNFKLWKYLEIKVKEGNIIDFINKYLYKNNF